MIRAARGRRSMHDGDLRNAGRRQARLVGETATALDEHFRLVEQIGAAAFASGTIGSLFSHRDLLHAQIFFTPIGGDRAAFDRVVAGDTMQRCRTRSRCRRCRRRPGCRRRVVVVHAEAGKGRELEQRRAGIEQKRDALARQQLLARAETVAPGIRGVAHLLFERAKFTDQRQHLLAIGAEIFRLWIDPALDDRHGNSFAHRRVRPGELGRQAHLHVSGASRRHKPVCDGKQRLAFTSEGPA